MAADRLQLLGMLSTSDFSSIFMARRALDNNGVVVVKSFNHAAYGDTDAGTRILHERALLELVNCRGGHPFVVGFRFAIVDSTFAYLAMDNVGGGDMYSLLQRHGPFPPRAARVYVAEVVLALAHLHSFDVVHRDVKPENILIELDGHIKLADLGSAKRMLGRMGMHPPPCSDGDIIGTPEYMAPECLLAQQACEDTDQWSTGCLGTEMMAGESPFAAADGNVETLVINVVHRPIDLPAHDNIGPAETDFLLALLRRAPHERLGSRANGGAMEIFEHAWFEGVPAKAFLTKQVPVPWVPHLNGPADHVSPPSDALVEMAEAALAPSLPPPEDSYMPPSCFAEFCELITVEISGPPTAPEAVPEAVPELPFVTPSFPPAASAAAEDDPAMWSDDEEAAHGEIMPSGGARSIAKADDLDGTPASVLDMAQLERRREAPLASGFSSRGPSPRTSPREQGSGASNS